MRTATSIENGKQERLGAPCLTEYSPASVDEVAASVGDDQIGTMELAEYVQDVVASRKGAVSKTDPNISVEVLDTLVQLRLTESFARSTGVTASVGDVETLVEKWNVDYGKDGDLATVLAANSIPQIVTDRYACAILLSDKLNQRYSTDAVDGEQSEFEVKAVANAKKIGVKVSSSIGFWNPENLAVQSTPWLESPSAPAVMAEKEANRTFATRVEYEITSIPDQEFDNSLDWVSNICIGTDDLLSPRYRDQIALYERTGGSWRRVVGAKASTKRGGRCDGGQVNILIGAEAPEPPINWTDKDWRTCTDYQVRIPETSNFRSSIVNMCVSTKAVSENEVS